jgi:hypothetical protein
MLCRILRVRVLIAIGDSQATCAHGRLAPDARIIEAVTIRRLTATSRPGSIVALVALGEQVDGSSGIGGGAALPALPAGQLVIAACRVDLCRLQRRLSGIG